MWPGGRNAPDVPFALREDPCGLRQPRRATYREFAHVRPTHARICPSPGAMPAHKSLEIDCAISIFRLNRCRRCREKQRRAERGRIKRRLHDRISLQFGDKHAPTVIYPSYLRTFVPPNVDKAKISSTSAAAEPETQGRRFSPRRNGQASCVRPPKGRTRSLGPRASQSSRNAHTKGAEYALLHLNGPGWPVGRPNERDMFLAIRKPSIESGVSATCSSQVVRRSCTVGPSLPPIVSASGLAHCATGGCMRRFSSPSNRAIRWL